MGLIVFISVVGLIALCIGIWGAIQLRNDETKTTH